MPSVSRQNGMTLLEILMALAIFGLVVTSMYGLFINVQRTTYNQEEVVDAQQNLRMSLDMISRDIKMAGALIPKGNPAVAVGSNATGLTLATASTFNTYALIADDVEVPGGATEGVFNLKTPDMAHAFSTGFSVRVIRPQDGLQPFDPPVSAELNVKSIDSQPTADDGDPASFTLEGFTNTDPVQFRAGDVIARVGSSAPDPSTIVWSLVGDQLRRERDASGFEVMASDIDSIGFGYLLEDGTETTTPTNSQLPDIHSVRITLNGTATIRTEQQFEDRQRSLTSVVRLRNRY